MKEQRTGLILKKIEGFNHCYISLGFYYFDYKYGKCIINYKEKELKLPLFNFEEDLSVYELDSNKIIESGLYNHISQLFEELNPKDVYQVFTITKIDEEMNQIFYDYDYNYSLQEGDEYINLYCNPKKHQRILK